MEKYKVQVTTRKNALLLIAATMLLIYAGLVFYRGGLPELPSFIKGFHTGAFIGFELCIVFSSSSIEKPVKMKQS